MTASLKARIRTIYERHKGLYGYRWITAALHQAGKGVNHKTGHLMHTLSLKSLVRSPKYRSSCGQSVPVPNVLEMGHRCH